METKVSPTTSSLHVCMFADKLKAKWSSNIDRVVVTLANDASVHLAVADAARLKIDLDRALIDARFGGESR